MASALVPVTFNKILQSQSYTVIILAAEKKKFAIYTEPVVGRNIQLFLTEEHKPRPYTHDLLQSILTALNIKVLQVVISGVEDTIYFARLFLEQQSGEERNILEIDVRPSDAITIAIMNNAPIFCRADVLEKTIPVEE